MHVAIFGATSALAVAAARLWAKEGAEFTLLGRNQERLLAVKGDLETLGAGRVVTQVADLGEVANNKKLIEDLLRAAEIDVALIAYGTLLDQLACQADFTLAERELRNNFLSVVALLSELANSFEAQKRGVLAVITSVAGDRGRQSNYIYGTAKGALNIFLQGLRNRLSKSGVCVLTIKPGFVDTPMTANLKHGLLWAKPETVGRAIYMAVRKRKDVLYTPWFWLVIMLIIKHIPESVFKRLKL